MDIKEAFSLLKAITDPSDVLRDPYESKDGRAKIVVRGGYTHTTLALDPSKEELVIQVDAPREPAPFLLARGRGCTPESRPWIDDVCIVSMAREAKKSMNKRKQRISRAMREANVTILKMKGKRMEAFMPLDTRDTEELKGRVASMMEIMGELAEVVPYKKPDYQKKDRQKKGKGGRPVGVMIRCSYCGSAVMPDKSGKCPNCGAPLL